MNTNVQTKFNAWAHSVNWQMPHQNDVQRFNDLIIATVDTGDKPMGYEEFEDLCRPFCKDEDMIAKHFSKYESGVDLLKQFEDK